MGVRCVECNSDELYGKAVLVKMYRIAGKGGGIITSGEGQGISRSDAKKQWQHDLTGEKKEV
jgi:hypothetical protein